MRVSQRLFNEFLTQYTSDYQCDQSGPFVDQQTWERQGGGNAEPSRTGNSTPADSNGDAQPIMQMGGTAESATAMAAGTA